MAGCRQLTPEERDRVAAAMGPRDRSWFLTGCATGYRVSELLQVRVGDVVLPGGGLADRLDVRRRAMKGRSSGRSVLVSALAAAAIGEYLAWRQAAEGALHADDYLWGDDGRPWRPYSRVAAWRAVRRACRKCGVGGRVGTHSMRKTFAGRVYGRALDLVAEGRRLDPLRVAREALGHAAVGTTEKYLEGLAGEADALVAWAGGQG